MILLLPKLLNSKDNIFLYKIYIITETSNHGVSDYVIDSALPPIPTDKKNSYSQGL